MLTIPSLQPFPCASGHRAPLDLAHQLYLGTIEESRIARRDGGAH